MLKTLDIEREHVMTSSDYENEHNNREEVGGNVTALHEEHSESEHHACCHTSEHNAGGHEGQHTCCGGHGHKREQFADYIRQDLEDLYKEHQSGNLLEKILTFVQTKPLEAMLIVFMGSLTLGYCLFGGGKKEKKHCKKLCKRKEHSHK